MKGEKNVGWQPETQPKGKPPVEKTKGAETMQRLIDANALYMELVKMKDFGELTAKKAIRVVEKAPTIDAEPVRHGKWIYGNDFHWYTASCNRCGYQRRTDIKADRWNQWNYCPNCGADMRGDNSEHE